MPYKTQSPDTSREAEEKYFELLRQLEAGKRFERMSAWSQSTIDLSRHAIGRAHPNWSRRQVLIEWAKRHYGAEILREVKVI